MSRQETSILVVDDDSVTRHFVCEVLRGLGGDEILQAGNGVEAQNILASHDVDLVITDLLMPGLDGLGLMRWARENRPGPRWIVLSGVDTFRAAIEAHQLGVIDFLSKPLAPEELEIAARNALDHLRLLRDRERLFTELEHANRQLSEQVIELEARSDVIRRDLQRAEIIQRALLPARAPDLDGFSLQAVYRPGLHVGGDLYDVVRIDERRFAFVVADATGHGVASAMLSVLFSRRVELSDERGPHSPRHVLEHVNDALIEDRIGPGLFVTAVCALLDTATRRLTLAAAGHPPAALHAAGATTWLPRTGPALGLVAHATYGEHSVTLGQRDRLLLFTDGLFDDAPATVRSRIAALLADSAPLDCSRLARLLEPDAGRRDADRDDATLLLLDATPGPSRFDNGQDHVVRARPAAAPATIWYGEGNDTRWIAVRGRGRWTDCMAFHDTVGGLIDEGLSVVIDLSDCEHLDSTFLGTTHELVCRALDSSRAPLVLNGVRDAVREAFAELSMERVLSCIGAATAPPPTVLHPLGYESDRHASRLRLLHAHEALAGLSENNRERFRKVTDLARAQLNDTARAPAAPSSSSDRTRPPDQTT
jgi:serine phosphatase RsbU (regulator of sigma subunit)